MIDSPEYRRLFKPWDEFTTLEKINHLQRKIIVNSYIYYELDDNVLSDKEYDVLSRELVKYKNDYPDIWRTSQYYKQFGDDYNGATGFTLFHDLDDREKNIIMRLAHARPRHKR